MLEPGRSYSAGNYRYGFNGQEKSSELNDNLYTAEYWEYDSRIVRRWNIDPKPTVGISPYSAFNNNPIFNSDPLGDTAVNEAGGAHTVDINEKINKLEFYGSSDYNITGTTTKVPVQPGQLRSFSNNLGTFTANWTTDANGAAVFSGYKNAKGRTIEQVVKHLNSLTYRTAVSLISWGMSENEKYNADPLAYNLNLSTNMLMMSATEAAIPSPYLGYNPSVTLSEGGEMFFGGNFAYRALTSANAETLAAGQGILAKAPNGSWTLEQHLIQGSSPKSFLNNPWIATSTDINIAKAFNSGNGIIRIDLSQMPASSMERGWMSLPRSSAGYHYSIWQQEVSIFGQVPQTAIQVIK